MIESEMHDGKEKSIHNISLEGDGSKNFCVCQIVHIKFKI